MDSKIVRTALFVPATNPERIPKAIASGADVVIVDLEDAVAESLKEQARNNLIEFLVKNPESQIFVRVNNVTHPDHQEDLAICREYSAVVGILLPKAESRQQLESLNLGNKRVFPIIETAKGLDNLPTISKATSIERLAFGSLDLSLDLNLVYGSEGAEIILNQARYNLILYSRIAELAQPLEGIFPDFKDDQGMAKAALLAKDSGFGGLLCIHPKQVAIIHDTLRPSIEELTWAKKIVAEANSKGVFAMNGEMIDAPTIKRAKLLLMLASEE